VKVDVASHTFQMEAIVPQLTDEFQDIIATPSDIVIYSSVLGSKIEGEEMTGIIGCAMSVRRCYLPRLSTR
jgi:acyl transferase domain-containing protein